MPEVLSPTPTGADTAPSQENDDHRGTAFLERKDARSRLRSEEVRTRSVGRLEGDGICGCCRGLLRERHFVDRRCVRAAGTPGVAERRVAPNFDGCAGPVASRARPHGHRATRLHQGARGGARPRRPTVEQRTGTPIRGGVSRPTPFQPRARPTAGGPIGVAPGGRLQAALSDPEPLRTRAAQGARRPRARDRVVSRAHLGESGSEVNMPRHNGNTPPKVKKKPPKKPPTSKR